MPTESVDPQIVDRFVSQMQPAVEAAAALARSLEGRVRNAPKLDEVSAVKQAMTVADTETQEVVVKALLESFPHVCLAAEEDTETVAAFPHHDDAQVVIDPIDGTLHSYLEARGPYAVIVGLAVREVYRAAMVSLPREGLTFDATDGKGAYVTVSGRKRSRAMATADGLRVLVSNGTPQQVIDVLERRGYEVIPACGGAVSIAPLIKGVCAGLRTAKGPLGISIRGRVGVLIAREGGALVKTAKGGDFPTDMYTPAETLLVASAPRQLEDLNEALASL